MTDAVTSSVARVHTLLGIARPATAVVLPETSSPTKRMQKVRGPNWNLLELKALVEAKRSLYLEESESNDRRKFMMNDARKWLRISALVHAAGASTIIHDNNACKSKWHQMLPE